MSDLISLWLEISPRSAGTYTTHLGSHIHGMVFSLLTGLDPHLATTIHDQHHKPFTVTGLLDERRRPTSQLTPGRPHYIRFTAFDPALTEPLLRLFLLQQPPLLRLGDTALDLIRAEVDQQAPGGGRTTYADLLAALPPTRFTLRFLSPTTLRQKGHNLPLPDPTGLFSGYLHRWNRFSPAPLPEELVQDAVSQGQLLLSRHRIRTEVLRLPAAPQVGFVGSVQFHLKSGPAAAALAALARFAAYCGSGYHSTQGMGQTQFQAHSRHGNSKGGTVDAGLSEGHSGRS